MPPRRRRQYGTGSIIQRADGRWVGRIDDGYTPDGKRRIRSVVRTTEAAAKSALRDLQRQIERGTAPEIGKRATVKAWAEQWLDLRRHTVRPGTYTADTAAVNQWIIPTVGRKSLTALTPADIRSIHSALRTAGKADSTAVRIHATTIKMLKDAYREGHDVPRRAIDTPPPTRGEPDRADIPVADAIRLIKSAEDSPMRSRWVAAILQGMRQGECLGLTWDAIDFESGTIDVSRQLKPIPYEHGCGGSCGYKRAGACPERQFRIPDGYRMEHVRDRWCLVEPKTKAARRIIPILPWMEAALRERYATAPDSPLVWANADGSVREDKQDAQEWRDLQKLAQVAKPDGSLYTLHECRHTTATILLALGIDPMIITRIMGHSSILSTRAYQHVDLVMIRRALDGVAEQLKLESS